MSDNLIENNSEISNGFYLLPHDKNTLINIILIAVTVFLIMRYYIKTRINCSKHKNVSSRMTIDNYISHIQNNNNIEQNAMKFLTLIYQDGLVPDLNIYSTLIEMSYRLNDFESVVNLFNNITNYIGSNLCLDVKLYEVMLESYKSLITLKYNKQQSTDFIKEEFIRNRDKIKLKEINFTPKIYFNLIQIHMELGEWITGWNYFCQMRRKTLFKLNLETTVTVLKGMTKNFEKLSIFMGNPNGILEEMFELAAKEESTDSYNHDLNTTLINELIILSSKFNLNDLTHRIYDEYFNRNLTFTSHSLLSLLIYFDENSQIENISSIYSYIKENDIHNLENIYSTLLKIFSKMKRYDLIEEIIGAIHHCNNLIPDEELHTQICIGSNLCKNYNDSIHFFYSIPLKILENAKIDLFNPVMTALIKTKDTARVFSLYKFILQQNKKSENFPRPDINTYSNLIEAYLIENNIQEARISFNYIKLNKSHLINLEFLNRISKIYLNAKCFGAALEIMYEMKKFNIKHNLKSYRIMFKIFIETLDELNAIVIFDQSIRDNIKPDIKIYYKLMQIFVKKNKIVQALGIYNDMKINNLQITSEIMRFIILSSLTENKIEEAALILLDNIKRKIPFESNTMKMVLYSIIDNTMPFEMKTKYLNVILKEIKENQILLDNEIYERLAEMDTNE